MSTWPRPVKAETREMMVAGSPIRSPAGVRTSTVMGEVPFDFARTGTTTEVSSFGRRVTAWSPTSVASGSFGGGVDSGKDSLGDEKRRITVEGFGGRVADLHLDVAGSAGEREREGLGRHDGAANRVGFSLDLRGHGGGLVVVDRRREQER